MTIYNKPDTQIFAKEAKQGEITSFPDLARGWGVTIDTTNGIPPMEFFNALQNRTDQALAYLMQRGVAEWREDLEYPKFAITILNGQVFFAKQQNIDKNPLSYPGIWVNSFAQKANVEDVYNKQEIDDLIGAQGATSIENLRTIEPKSDGERITLLSYYEGGTTGGGEFVADMVDGTTADNGGTVIVTSAGNRWKRVNAAACLEIFGYNDNVSNVDNIFLNFEQAFQNELVDLKNKKYITSKIYASNKYVNGYFIVNNNEYSTQHSIQRDGNGLFLTGDKKSFPESYKKELDEFDLESNVIAIGNGALKKCTDANHTIAIGTAMANTKKSYSNIAIGESAFQELQSSGANYWTGDYGSRNIAIGANAFQFLKTGNRNIALGRNSGTGAKEVTDCTLIGANIMHGSNNNGWNTFVENHYGNDTVNARVTSVGCNSAYYLCGDLFTGMGYAAGRNLKKGAADTFIGHQAGEYVDDKIGWGGFVKTTYGESGVGVTTTYNKNGSLVTITLENHKCVVGGYAYVAYKDGPIAPKHKRAWRQKVIKVTSNTVSFNCPYPQNGSGTAVIEWSTSLELDDNSNKNVLVGNQAGRFANTLQSTIGIGHWSLNKINKASESVFIGDNSGSYLENINATGCVAIGAGALKYSQDDLAQATAIGLRALGNFKSGARAINTTAVGYQAGFKMQDGSAVNIQIDNCTLLGANTAVSGRNQVQLGSSTTTTYAYGAIQNRSDRRDKADIRDTKLGLDFIKKLRPVDYKWDYREDYENRISDGSKKRKRYHQGFIAQEIEDIIKETGVDFGGYQDHSKNGGCDVKSLGYVEFIAPLVKAVQELNAKIEKIEAKLK